MLGSELWQQYIAVYMIPVFSNYQKELEKLGKYRVSKSCLYINKLIDVDEKGLRRIIRTSVAHMQKKYDL